MTGGAGLDHSTELCKLQIAVTITCGLGKPGCKLMKGTVARNETFRHRRHQILLVLWCHFLLQDKTVMDILRKFRNTRVIASNQCRYYLPAGVFDGEHFLAQQILHF